MSKASSSCAFEILSPSTTATGSFKSRPAEPSAPAGVAVGDGVGSAGVEAADGGGVEGGVSAGLGVGVAVGAGVAVGVGAGVAVGVAAGVGVPAGSAGAGGGVGLQERRATAAAKVSTREDALFISKEAFLRTGRKSKPVEICIFQFTA